MAVADASTTNKATALPATYPPVPRRKLLGLFQNESPFLLVFILLGIMSLIIITMSALAMTS